MSLDRGLTQKLATLNGNAQILATRLKTIPEGSSPLSEIRNVAELLAETTEGLVKVHKELNWALTQISANRQ